MKIPTLYHGTIRVNAKSLRQLVAPRIGRTVARVYGTKHRPLFFATTDPLQAVEYAVMAIEEQSPNAWRSPGPLPWDDLPAKGAIAIFEAPSSVEWKHCSRHGECADFSVEPGDWYTHQEVKPTRVLTGRALVHFMGRHGFRKPSLRSDLLLKENRS